MTVDAFEASDSGLLEGGQIAALLRLLVQELETADSDQLEMALSAEDGSSAGLLQGETELFMHVFPSERRVNLRLFTRRDVPVSPLMLLLRKQFATSRFESHITGVSKVVDHSEAAMQQLLAGDRSYARSRFQYLHRAE